MSHWLDDAARGLSTGRYSRRQVLGRAAVVAGGGLLASAGRPLAAFARISGQADVGPPPGDSCDGKPIDRRTQKCCVRYLPKSKTYAELLCDRDQQCCRDPESKPPDQPTHCCGKDEKCCGKRGCCGGGETCCQGRCIDLSAQRCCVKYLPKSKTYAELVCKRTQKCCYDPGSSPVPGLPHHCCEKSEKCCGATGCCKQGQVCCGGKTCCSAARCKNGKCGDVKCPPGSQACFNECTCPAGWKCCPSGNCTGTLGNGVCCSGGNALEIRGLSDTYTPCCIGGVFGVICGGKCCPNDRPCCGRKFCCAKGTIGCRYDGDLLMTQPSHPTSRRATVSKPAR